MATHEVVIDGVIYVPAVTAVPGLDAVMQALYESYMGAGKHWNDGDEAKYLWVTVNEDQEGDTLEEFAARVAEAIAR